MKHSRLKEGEVGVAFMFNNGFIFLNNVPDGLPAHFDLFLYIGTAVCSALVLAIRVLWAALQNRDKYIREQDRKNLEMLNNMVNMLNVISTEIGRLPDDVARKVNVLLAEIANRIKANGK